MQNGLNIVSNVSLGIVLNMSISLDKFFTNGFPRIASHKVTKHQAFTTYHQECSIHANPRHGNPACT